MSKDPRALQLGAQVHEGPFTYHGISAPLVRDEVAEMIRQGVAIQAAAYRCETCRQHFVDVMLITGRLMNIVIPGEAIESCPCTTPQKIVPYTGDLGSLN